MKRVTLLVVLALLATSVAYGIQGTTDVVPAATLLFPYFEVDLANANGNDTTLAISNASATAILLNVVIWTDRSVPVGQFFIYLTGYDVQRFSMRDVLVNGAIPVTASDGQDPGDTASPDDGISNQGPLSQDINFASCTGILPHANFSAEQRASMQAALTGVNSTLLGGCAGAPHGDSVARGYVTVDTVNACVATPHTNPDYYAQTITFQNVLLGDYTIRNLTTGHAQTDTAAHIETPPFSNFNDPLYTTPGRYTFYGRYNAWTATDRREPLGAKWAASYIREASHLIAWRDTKTAQTAFPCGSTPAPFPLGHARITVWDVAENVAGIADDVSKPFPEETGRVLMGGATFPVPHKLGWAYLNLGATAGTDPSSDPDARQSYVTAIHYPEAWTSQVPLSFGFTAVELENVAMPNNQFGDPEAPAPPAASAPSVK